MKPLSCFLAIGVSLSCVASAADSYESLRQETRQAIARGNAWLKNQQKADGFWDDPELPAITALALNAAVRDPNLKAGEKLPAYAGETCVDAVGLDETIDPAWAARALPEGLPVQGNLDPLLLLSGGTELERQALHILDCLAGRPHVFNLGHGIGQHTPVEHVEQLLAVIRGWRG